MVSAVFELIIIVKTKKFIFSPMKRSTLVVCTLATLFTQFMVTLTNP